CAFLIYVARCDPRSFPTRRSSDLGIQTNADFLRWGWRVPFLLSAILVIVGWYIRNRVTESPMFEAEIEAEAPVSTPAIEVFRERSEEHTSELQSRSDLVCRLLLEK